MRCHISANTSHGRGKNSAHLEMMRLAVLGKYRPVLRWCAWCWALPFFTPTPRSPLASVNAHTACQAACTRPHSQYYV